MLLALPVLLPVLTGALLPLLLPKAGKRLRQTLILLPVLVTSALVWLLLSRGPAASFTLLPVTWRLALRFRLDGAAMLFAGLVSVLWPLATLYAFEYMEHEQHPVSFFTFYVISYGVTLGVALAADLFTLYVFYECLTLCTLPLVTHKQDAASVRAGRRYLYYCIGGAALAFVALMLTLEGDASGLFTLGGVLSEARAARLAEFLPWLYVIGFLGFGVKAAVFPLSAWLPAASVAPTPVTALLHAVAVVNAGAFAVTRFTWYTLGPDLIRNTWARPVLLALSCFTVVLASVLAVRERHLKRRLAWSTVSNLSYMLVGITMLTSDALTGSLAHLCCHGVMKMGLFLCAGAILTQSGLEYVTDLRGLKSRMPVTCALFTLGAAAMTGVPPLCGFISKWQLLTAAGSLGGLSGLMPMIALIISSVLTAVYLFTVSATMLFRPAEKPLPETVRDPGWRMLLPLFLLAAGSVLLGLGGEPFIRFLQRVSAGLL